MIVQMNYDGHVYDLPKYTLEIVKKMDAIHNEQNVDMQVQMMFDFVSRIVGVDELSAIVGSTLPDTDLIELFNIYNAIDHTYADAIHVKNSNLDDAQSTIEKLGGMDNVIKLLNAVNK